MNKELMNSINTGPIGRVTLNNGGILEVPKLTNLKLIKLAKFFGIDGMRLYESYQEVIKNESLSDSEKIFSVLTDLDEALIVRALAILLNVEDEDALNLDPVETLEVIEIYIEKTDLLKAFTIVRNLIKKFTGKEIPDVLSMFQMDPQQETISETPAT